MPKTKLSPADLEALKDSNLPAEVIALGRRLGNVALADDLLKVDDDVYPSDPDAIDDMLVVSKDLEAKAWKAYANLKRTIGKKLDAAHQEYMSHRERSDRLFALSTGQRILRSGDGGGY